MPSDSPPPRQDGPRAPTEDSLRRDIDAGRTGDKVPVSDPAAAPLGADAETAGVRVSPAERVRTGLRARAVQARGMFAVPPGAGWESLRLIASGAAVLAGAIVIAGLLTWAGQ